MSSKLQLNISTQRLQYTPFRSRKAETIRELAAKSRPEVLLFDIFEGSQLVVVLLEPRVGLDGFLVVGAMWTFCTRTLAAPPLPWISDELPLLYKRYFLTLAPPRLPPPRLPIVRELELSWW